MEKVKKMTQSEMYDFIKENMSGYPEVVEFCDLKKAQIAKKRDNSKTSQEVQEENEAIKEMLLNALASFDTPVTVSDLLNVESIANFVTREGKKLSSQKITYILKSMSDKVVNTKDKKKSLYSLI